MDAIRVLALTPDFPPARGGIQVLVHRLVRHADRLQTRVVARSSPGSQGFDRAESLDIRRAGRAGAGPASNLPLNARGLYEARRFRPDVVLSGHDHSYERFAPQTPAGASDAVRGIREFVVGTGGKSHYALTSLKANSEVFNGETYGVLKMTLSASSYAWQFVPVPGSTFTDSGTAQCH